MLTGTIKFGRPWSYKLAGDYNEGRLEEDQIFDGLDANVTIPLWGDATASIGKQKEPFIYEMAGDAANLPQHERMLSPFFVSRSVGISVTDTLLAERMTWTAGWFDDSGHRFCRPAPRDCPWCRRMAHVISTSGSACAIGAARTARSG